MGRRAAVELPRRALERRQLLLPRADDCERRCAGGRSGARRHARGRAWRRLPRCLHAAVRLWERCGAGARAVRRRVSARVREPFPEARLTPSFALDERAAVRSERRVVHVPAVDVGELHLSFDDALGWRYACDGARQRLLVGVGGAGHADVPHWRRGAPRGVGELDCARVQRDACGSGRGSYRGEQQRA